MKEKKYLEEASLWMATVDAIPVVFFAVSMILIFTLYQSVLFAIGAAICVSAGLAKVLWKVILALSKKNKEVLYNCFGPMMGSGFGIIILSMVVNHNSISKEWLWKNVSSFPGNIIFILSLIAFVGMIVIGAKLDMSNKRYNWLEQITNLLAQLFLLCGVILIVYSADYYKAGDVANVAIEDKAEVKVNEISNGLFFDGKGEEKAIIFYPGAKVEYTAYAPLMQKIAEQGVDCFLVDMPYNLAMFGKNKAANIMKEYSYKEWYMSGHSLGGVSASGFAADNFDDIKGMIFIASYPTTSLVHNDFKVLSIYGSEDKVLNKERFDEADSMLPKNLKKECIEGGNHGGFADYGHQDGDGEASIDNEVQQEKTAEYIANFVNE